MSEVVKMSWPSSQYRRSAPFNGLMILSQTSLPNWASEKSYLEKQNVKDIHSAVVSIEAASHPDQFYFPFSRYARFWNTHLCIF